MFKLKLIFVNMYVHDNKVIGLVYMSHQYQGLTPSNYFFTQVCVAYWLVGVLMQPPVVETLGAPRRQNTKEICPRPS